MRALRRGPGAMVGVRPAAVAGRFYEGRPDRLAEHVDGLLARARTEPAMIPAGLAGAAADPADVRSGSLGRPQAVVVPHAGHVYSGLTAAYAYAALDPAAYDLVVLLGPAHYVPVDGIGTSSARAWQTPLGTVPLDGDLAEDLHAHVSGVHLADAAHGPEHSLEVQLPFLQRVLQPGWRLLPLLVGDDLPAEVADAITRCLVLPRTLVVVSSDLSHYLDHDSARERDDRTLAAMLARRADLVGAWDACGRHPVRGLLTAAAGQDWAVHLLDTRTSGDTAGERDRVVGYAALALTSGGAFPGPRGARGEAASTGAAGGAGARFTPTQRAALLRLAREVVAEGLRSGRRPRFEPHGWDPVLLAPGAAFVTLRSREGELLGCIGSLAATQSLASDVASHAFDAAFRDPRFPPLSADRAQGMVIDISVLSPSEPFAATGYDDLVARVPRGVGLTVETGRHRATFLPAVWEQLPRPEAFVAALWRKAGLGPRAWPADITLQVYAAEEFAEQ